ncbi:hypothetical protein XELAEV_18043139mg [Xenopus laevis]|uniref:Ubiquitin-like protease family profile domain-containing protein n=1 Tax=Xenopus laevis TaxID=8355 RepID=A0A974BX11_XENLA|nr:hypothetical protein XELAEV_18043139mg [Xenopus laevis]
MASVKSPRLLKAIKKSIVKPFKKLFSKEKNNKNSIKPINEENDDDEGQTCCFPKCKILKRFKKQKEKVIFSQEVSVETQPRPEEKNLKKIKKHVSFAPETNDCLPEEKNLKKIEKPVSFAPETNDWLPDLNLTRKHKEELQGNAWLDDTTIDAAQKLLKRQFNTEGLQTCVLSEIRFEAVHGPSVQIHFDNTRNHWLTSCFKSDHVEIADSMKASKLPYQVKKQINECYGQVICEPTKTMKQLNVDQQQNGYDCGVYAIAIAFEFLSNGDPTCRYDGKMMRKHLINCLERGEITAFPRRFGLTESKRLPCKSSMVIKKREIEDEKGQKEVEKKKEDEVKDNFLKKKELSPLLSFRIHFNNMLQDWFRFGFQTWNRLSAQLYLGSNWQDWFRRGSWNKWYKCQKTKKKGRKSLSFQEPTDAAASSADNRSKVMAFIAGSATMVAFYFFWKKP